jgi:nucleoside-diphosphate-sugar epimerase
VNREFRSVFGGRRTLVTGGLGFIGSNLVRRLVELGADVTVIDALVPGYGGNLFNVEDVRDRIHLIVDDVRDAPAIEACVEGRDHVFNLVGQVSHTDSMSEPELDLENNCRAPLAVLEACRRVNRAARVVYSSTRQIYGRPERMPVDESHPCRPVDVNGIHKWTAEQYHRLYDEVYGIACVVLRLSNTFGPGVLVKHPRQGFIGWFLRKVVEGGEIELMGDGTQLRDMNYVDDVVDALLLAAATPAARGQTYNLGAPAPVSLGDLARRMVEIAGRGSIRHVPFPPERKRIDVGSVTIDWSRIRRELGWSPRVEVDEGLTRSIRYYEQHLDRYLD